MLMNKRILINKDIFQKSIKHFSSSSLLTNISPLDGRYSNQVNELRPFFSEYALMRYRVLVELKWYKKLFEESIVS